MSFQRFLQLVERLGTLAATDAIEEVSTSTRGRRTEIVAKTTDGTPLISACILTRPLPTPNAQQLVIPMVGLRPPTPEPVPEMPKPLGGVALSFAGLGVTEVTAGLWAREVWPHARWEEVSAAQVRGVVTQEGADALRAAQAVPGASFVPVTLPGGTSLGIECWGGESPENADMARDVSRRILGGEPRMGTSRGETSIALHPCADETLLATAISYLVAAHVPFALRARQPRKARAAKGGAA